MENLFKAALFDLDGVVFDTEPQYTSFWGEQCREFHPETPHLEREIKGQTLTQIYDRYFSGSLEPLRDTVTARLDEFEKSMAFSYVAGFESFVAALRGNGVGTAVVTSSNRAKMANVYSKRPELKTLFDEILTAEDFESSKPAPDCYLKAASRFGAKPGECIVFEDSFNGLKAGRAAMMAVVGLATTNTAEAIEPYCDLVVSDFIGIDYARCSSLLENTSVACGATTR